MVKPDGSHYFSKTHKEHLDAKKKYIDILKKSGFTLLHIIDDILDISKIESGNFKLEENSFQLNDLINDTLEILEQKAHAKNLVLDIVYTTEAPTLLNGDYFRIKQVLTNLIGNSIKFTPKGSIKVRSSNNQDGNILGDVLFEIIDSGIGIAKEEQKKLLIINFIALLELLRTGSLRAEQSTDGGDITILSPTPTS